MKPSPPTKRTVYSIESLFSKSREVSTGAVLLVFLLGMTEQEWFLENVILLLWVVFSPPRVNSFWTFQITLLDYRRKIEWETNYLEEGRTFRRKCRCITVFNYNLSSTHNSFLKTVLTVIELLLIETTEVFKTLQTIPNSAVYPKFTQKDPIAEDTTHFGFLIISTSLKNIFHNN